MFEYNEHSSQSCKAWCERRPWWEMPDSHNISPNHMDHGVTTPAHALYWTDWLAMDELLMAVYHPHDPPEKQTIWLFCFIWHHMWYIYLATYIILIYTHFMLMWSHTTSLLCFRENYKTVHLSKTKTWIRFMNSQNEW